MGKTLRTLGAGVRVVTSSAKKGCPVTYTTGRVCAEIPVINPRLTNNGAANAESADGIDSPSAYYDEIGSGHVER
jgi:hypothetical protein